MRWEWKWNGWEEGRKEEERSEEEERMNARDFDGGGREGGRTVVLTHLYICIEGTGGIHANCCFKKTDREWWWPILESGFVSGGCFCFG
jgi:hypothetical protein